MKKNKKKIDKPFCDFSYFMRHGCHGCIRSQTCENYYSRKDDSNEKVRYKARTNL